MRSVTTRRIATAALAGADTYGLTKTRDMIVGHSEVPDNDHTDPDPNWDYYMNLVTA